MGGDRKAVVDTVGDTVAVQSEEVWRDPEADLLALVGKLDLEGKVRLLTGADFWTTPAEPLVGLRPMVLSDGPAGVRGRSFDERDPSLSLPSGPAVGATWDTALARRYGAVLGAEARRQGVDVVLGPTINLQRTPFNGRYFEAFAEDPLLTGELAAAYVAGMQAAGVGATLKHFVANDAETDRFTADNRIDERTLREVHLAVFEPAVVRARAWLVMSAYNSVNGATMTENPLLRSPLAEEWDFDGVVVSDWTAVRSTEASANAAQDLVMPGPAGPWGDRLVEAVRAGRVPESAVDEKVLRLLRLAARVGALESVPPAIGTPPAPEDGAALAREVAATGMVLVRNTGELPWDPAHLGSVAVLGQNAASARTQGGGSATVRPYEVVSPLAGLRAALGEENVRYRLGATVTDGVQAFLPEALTNPVTGERGVRVRYLAADGTELSAEDRLASALVWLGDVPEGADTIELRTVWAAPAGTHRVGAAALGRLRLSVDGTDVLDAVTTNEAEVLGAAFFRPPSAETTVVLPGGATEIVLRYTGSDPDLPMRAVTLGTRTVPEDPDTEIAAAAALAAESDVALVVVGTDEAIESEGFDRTTLALPGRQDDLVRAVAAANPRTVVLVNSGAPVLMPWRHEVAAVLLGWFGGERFGEAVADVLLGVREPGGRLAATWPATGDEGSIPTGVPVDGVVEYTEGIHTGYRSWLRNGEEPAYPFGHGLGYTEWGLLGVEVPESVTAGEPARIQVELANTGDRRGRQVLQVYLSRPDSAVERPVRWLAGWAVVVAEPGRATASVLLPQRAFQHWADGDWHVEPGTFTLHVGLSAVNTLWSGSVTVR